MEKEEDIKVKVENELQAKDQGEDEDCSEVDLVEFSRKLSINTSSDAAEDEDDEVVVLGTKGPVALRDFPHPRNLCANFPFDSTPHENYCSKCYCVLCKVVAPCSNWKGKDAHCNVISKNNRENIGPATNPEKKNIFIIEEYIQDCTL